MKPGMRYDASKSGNNVMVYYVQPSLLGGYTGKYNIDKASFANDSAVAIGYTPAAAKAMETVKKLFEIEGIKNIKVEDLIISVEKIIASEWLADGIHEAICEVLKTDLYPGHKNVDIRPLPGCDFPEK